ncbi:MAG: GTP-binding protein [Candidatus Heimdallarchaeota archaeon]|nr:GTP-binding protein [Candidatus Heimdallarchaeota archaeon]
MKKKFISKLVLIGDPAVGKTSLKTYLTQGKFDASSQMTIGADVTRYALDISDEFQLILQIWDIAGQTKHGDLAAGYYKGSKGALVIFDMTRADTFENIPFWLDMLMNSLQEKIPIMLIGNKIDLSNQVKISKDQVFDYAKVLTDWLGYNVPVAFTSAKTGENVNDSFFNVANSMLDRVMS